MKGHIVQRSKGAYSLVLELGPHPETGKRQQKWITFRGTKRKAEDELAKRLNEVNTGDFVDPDKATVGEFFEQWLSVVAEQKVGQKTLDRYKGIVKHHIGPAFGRLPLQRLTALHIESHYSRLTKEGRKDGREGDSQRKQFCITTHYSSEALQKDCHVEAA